MHLRVERHRHRRPAVVIAATVLLVGCADGASGKDEKNGSELSGTAAVGAPVVGATLTARCADGTGFTRSVTTDDAGHFSGSVAKDVLPCALQLHGGSLPSGAKLHSFASAAGTVNVTPLTDLVVALASEQMPSSWFDSGNWQQVEENIQASEQALLAALVDAAYTLPAGSPFTTPFEATVDHPWDQVLEQLQAAIDAAPELDGYLGLVERLRAGELDGFPTAPGRGGEDDSGAPLEDAGTSMKDGSTFLEDGGTPAGDGGMDGDVAPPDSGSDATTDDAGDTVAATLHPSLFGSKTLTFKAGDGAGCGDACSYVDNQEVPVTIGADDSLTIDGKKLTDPYHRILAGAAHAPEIIWRDGDIEYALSDNVSGTFNEINVGDLARPQNGLPLFLGQLTAANQDGNALITQFAGTYAITHHYKGDLPAWTGVTIGADGSFAFQGGAGPNVSASQIGEVFDRLSCCGRVDVRVGFDLNGDGTISGVDRLELYATSTGTLKDIVYPVSSSSSDDVGVTVADLEPLPAHDGTAIPADDRIAGSVDGNLLSIPVDEGSISSVSSLTLTASLLNASSMLEQRWNLRMGTDGGPEPGQTYPCHENKGPGPSRKTIRLEVKTSSANGSDYSSEYGGRCQITITSVEIGGPTNSQILSIEGTFVAELYPFKRNNPPIVINDGVLRWVP